ncbi:to-interacting 1 [Olea europaea subsp. europaea]|uniref:To-interacting 1, partial n=1 Tax=Olea europaea subsp. europaea TaxID=158383 RepID=A0A8S0P870_OLEEU|nr:to-interacting 1 [Olea europaea subsp. europaea]
MDSQDHQISTGSKGHEIHGVQLCHRCGWPFPNPHPSARHRRAHKRVCGKVEGYKLIESEAEDPHLAVSDEEHSSDEDHQTPSTKAEKQNIKESYGNGGASEKSNRSEDEMFTDAVAEFSDSGVSPGLDERLESVSDKSVEKGVVDELNSNQLMKSDETAKITEQLDDLTSSSQTLKLECAVDQLEESIVPPSDTTSEAVSVGFTNALQSSHVKSESQTDVITGNINEDGDRKMQQEPVSAKQFVDAKGETEEAYLKSSESVTLDSAEEKTSDLNVIVVDRAEKLSDKLDSEVIKHEVYPQNETTENADAFAEVKKDADSATDINIESDHKLIEACKSEVGQHLLPANLPGVNPEVIIEDFKDLKYIQSKLPLDPSSVEITRSTEAVDECATVEYSSAHSVKPVGSMPSSYVASSDFNAVEDNLEAVANTSTFRETSVNVETCGLEHREGTSGAENHKIQTNCSTLELQSHSVDSSQNALYENSPINGSDIVSIISSADEEVKQETNVHGGGENASNWDISKSDKGVIVGNEMSKGDSEDVLCVYSKSTPDNAGKSFASNDDQTTKTLVEDSNYYDEKSSSMLLDAGNGSEEAGGQGKLTNNEGAKNPYFMQSLNPADFSTSDRTAEHPISDELAPLPKDSESLKQNSAEQNSCSDDGVIESEPMDAVGMGGELNLDGNTVILSETHDKSTLKEQKSVPVGQEFLNATSAAVENRCASNNDSTLKSVGIDSGVELIHDGDIVASDNHSPISISKEPGVPSSDLASDNHLPISISKEPGVPPSDPEVLNKSSDSVDDTLFINGEKVSGISFEPSQDEAYDKLTKQKDGNSSVFISGASSSPTESLEGNWGSVVSLQSDPTPTAETDSQGAEKSEANIQKQEAKSTEGHPHKSDDFEPPSFGTLVQSAEKVNQEGSASEIEMAQNAQQPKSEALPQGWFPSITNVVNESEGRKKNEETIAKVTNWSSEKQHSPLKNLLSEAKSPNPKQVPAASQKDESATKDNDQATTTVNSTSGSGAPNKEMEEWNSPARYPTEIKKEKKRGKPYWVPFVCCSSVHTT